MTKTDLIRFRCTPEFKARIQKHADFLDLSMSEYIEQTLEAATRAVQPAAPLPAAAEQEPAALPAVATSQKPGGACEHGKLTWQFCAPCFERQVTR